MADSSTVSSGDQALASDYNNLREDVVKSALVQLSSVAGTDTITATADGQYDAYTAGSMFIFEPAADNTGAATINISTLGAKDIKKSGTSGVLALGAGDLQQDQPAIIVYDGTQFILLSTIPEAVEFFANTGITGAEAETLTDGSDASALHSHKVTTGYATRASGAGTGTQNVAHGLGVTPQVVVVKAWEDDSNVIMKSEGTVDSTLTDQCIYWYTKDAGGGQIGKDGLVIRLIHDGGTQVEASVSAMNATNITFNFTTMNTDCGWIWTAWA